MKNKKPLSVPEMVLIGLLETANTKQLQSIVLESYIEVYGGLSPLADSIVKGIVKGADNVRTDI